MIEFRYDTQCLIDGHDLDEDKIDAYIKAHFKGDSLIAVGDSNLIKIHFHTNEPWIYRLLCHGGQFTCLLDFCGNHLLIILVNHCQWRFSAVVAGRQVITI